ncbi:EXOC7 [Cordylochernes scorpioides]|uniref:EXOC7 n=1 Tax=Cordylochernes scorpioides TaxID=51811 RepID=A0ABY6KV81_9ARAC|nr:EXOC7 [Cordylochernes scorpioides]
MSLSRPAVSNISLSRPDVDNALQPGNEYRYKVSSRATTEITGVSSDRGVVDVNCDVTVSNVRSCFYELQLRPSELTLTSAQVKRCTAKSMSGAPGSETPIVAETELTAAAAHPVLFSLSHGHLHSVLAHKDDHLPGLNLKRGIISLLSVPSNAPATDSEGHKHEDVQGVCYRYVTRNGDNIRTVKDVNSCSEPSRMDWQLSPFSLFWNMSFARVLINSSNECDYTLQGDSLKKAICHERHAAMVHSNQETALSAQTNVHYELNLQETKKAKKAAEKPLTDLRVTSIQYEYERTPDPQSNPPDFKNRAEKMLSDLVIGSKDEVQLQNVDQYHNFIELLRTASDVLPFVKSVISCSYLQGAECNDDLKETSKQLLQGALVQCNSIACMKAVTHLTVYEHISPSYLNLVLYSWTHLAVNKPEYLDEILAICKSRDYRLCWLSLGIAIHTYTDRHPEALTSGQMPASITNTVNHLSSFLGQDCNIEEASFPPDFTPLQKYDYMRGIIKAIGNIGEAAHVVKPEVIQQLGRCARNNELHPNVRVAAVESIERMHSSQDVYRTLMGMLQDRSLPVDVRQASYIGLAEHITHYDISNDIAKLLKDEHITQVKTYIVSHLRNLIDKEHPSEHEQQ